MSRLMSDCLFSVSGITSNIVWIDTQCQPGNIFPLIQSEIVVFFLICERLFDKVLVGVARVNLGEIGKNVFGMEPGLVDVSQIVFVAGVGIF